MTKAKFSYDVDAKGNKLNIEMECIPEMCCMECAIDFLNQFVNDVKAESGGPAPKKELMH